MKDLLNLLTEFDAVISNDSGPLHMAMALKIPTVGLYVNSAAYKLTPIDRGPAYRTLEGYRACWKWNWRWKHHCLACTARRYSLYGCNLKEFDNKLDLIAIEDVERALAELLVHDRASPA